MTDRTMREVAAAALGRVVTPYIAALKAENERLRAALRPFVFGDPMLEKILFGHLPDDATGTITVKNGDFRRARAALDAAQDAQQEGKSDGR